MWDAQAKGDLQESVAMYLILEAETKVNQETSNQSVTNQVC